MIRPHAFRATPDLGFVDTAGNWLRFGPMTTWFSKLRSRLIRSAKAVGHDDTFTEEWDAVTARARRDMEARHRALAPLRPIVEDVSVAMLKADPIALRSVDGPKDEYDPEAETVVMRLSELRRVPTQTDVLRVVHEEFVHWFGDVAGTEARYVALSTAIHDLWHKFLASED